MKMKYLTVRFPIRYVNHFTFTRLIQFAEYLPEIKVNNPASNVIPIDDVFFGGGKKYWR